MYVYMPTHPSVCTRRKAAKIEWQTCLWPLAKVLGSFQRNIDEKSGGNCCGIMEAGERHKQLLKFEQDRFISYFKFSASTDCPDV